MGVEFSAKISMLRKESEITQRQAAQELGISQALLSHYEKGIRECSLEFVKKAAQYYGVSTDFLLGLTDVKNRASQNETRDSDDGTLTAEIIIRALTYLSGRSAESGEQGVLYFNDYFSLAIKKYVSLFSENALKESMLNDISMTSLIEMILRDRRRQLDITDAPSALATVIGAADRSIANTLHSLTDNTALS